MAKNIYATLSMNAGNFFSGAKSAVKSVESLKEAVTSANHSAKDFGSDARANVSKWKTELASAKVEIAKSQSALSSVTAEQEKANAAYFDAKSRVSAIKAEQQLLNQQTKAGTVNAEQAKKKQEQLNEKLEQAQDEVEKTKTAQQQVKVKIDSAKSAVSKAKAKQEELNAEIQKGEAEIKKEEAAQQDFNDSLIDGISAKQQNNSSAFDGISAKQLNNSFGFSEGIMNLLSNTGGKLSGIASSAAGGPVAIGVAATTAAISAGAAFLGKSVDMGKEFQAASKSIAAQTGLSGEKLEYAKQVLKDIYAENYGDNFQDIGDAISIIAQNSKAIDSKSIKELTTNAIVLRDTFDYDIQESSRAANMLMEQFGVTGEEAYNLITQGSQKGLDKNGDLLDTINEYSVHYRQIGMDADDMFNSLVNGAAAGTFSVDKLGDAVKEFGIRVKDGTADDAFEKLGLSADETAKAFAEGGESGKKAFKSVTDALFSVDDRVQQNMIGVQLFGTMWEDLGADGVKALSNINGEIDQTHSSMEELKKVKYDDLDSALEGVGRLISTSILLPIGEKLTPVITDFVNAAADKLEDGSFVDTVSDIGDGIASTAKAIGDGILFVVDNWDKIKPVLSGLSKLSKSYNYVSGTIDKIKDTVDIFGNIKQEYQKLGGIKGIVFGVFDGVKQTCQNKFDEINNLSGGKFGEAAEITKTGFKVIKVIGINAFDSMKTSYEEHGGGIKGVFFAIMDGGKSIFSQGFTFLNMVTAGKAGELLNTVTTKFQSIKDAIGNAINTAKDMVVNAVDSIKNAFNFEWKLPSLKVPTINKTGEKEIMGIKIPTFDVSWNAKGGIFRRPTILSSTSGLQGVGEAGSEAIMPLDLFWNKLRKFVVESNSNNTANGNPKHNQNKININIYAQNKSMRQIVNELMPELEAALGNM